MIQNTATPVPNASETLAYGWRSRPGILVFLGGIFLPALALGAELIYHLCRQVFFNPLPTLLHLVLVGFVPAANLWLFIVLIKGKADRNRLLVSLNGVVIGICTFYSLIFLPILPIGLIAILGYGLGLLILAPPLALAASLRLRWYLAQNLTERPRGMWTGFACALSLLLIVEVPSAVTRWGMQLASSEDPVSRVRGIRTLRAFGNKDLMLRLCYAWPTRATDLTGFLLSLGKPVGTKKARSIYYQVQGVIFNSLPPPERENQGWLDFERRTEEQGSTMVAGQEPGLSLSTSRIDASIDAQAALAYQEWTLEFENQGTSAVEARAQIELPPEGVVSRLTLWVNGEEREAAFASRSRVRSAYEAIVRTSRDPVLVTSQGQDRVLLQCFPVLAGGGRIKVRLGITSPLTFSITGETRFHAPRFSERNFGISGKADRQVHSLWLESTEPFSAAGEDWDQGNEGNTHTLRGLRSETWLEQGPSWGVGGSNGNHEAWTADTSRLGKGIVRQWSETTIRAPLGKLTLVVDGSRGLRPYLETVGRALRLSGRPVRIVMAGNEQLKEFTGTAQEAGNWIEGQPCEGGQDNIPALMRGWEAVAKDQNGVLLWITAPQPELVSSPEFLRQSLERQTARPRIFALQVGNGPNRLLEQLDGLHVSLLRPSGDLQEELESLLSLSPVSRMVLMRKRDSLSQVPDATPKTSNHLARLFANQEITRLLDEGGEVAREKAVSIASTFQLVTPVSGAVVLESAGQYAAAGLEPVGAATVPGIPEPEMVWLALAAAGILLTQVRPWRYLKRLWRMP